MSSLVRALGVYQRMEDEQPVALPEAKPVADPTGECGPDSSDLDKRRKCKTPKKVPKASKKNVRKNLRLELLKPEGTVRFDTIVLAKCGKQQTLRLLKGYSCSDSLFARKRTYQKLRMHQNHQQRELTPRRLKVQQHVRDTLAKVNS